MSKKRGETCEIVRKIEKRCELRYCQTGEIMRASATFREPSDAAAKREEGLNKKEKFQDLNL